MQMTFTFYDENTGLKLAGGKAILFDRVTMMKARSVDLDSEGSTNQISHRDFRTYFVRAIAPGKPEPSFGEINA